MVSALLLVGNVVSNRVVPRGLYVPWNLTVAAAVLAVALAAGHRRDELGLAGGARAWRWTALAVGAVALVLVTGATLGATQDLFVDRRVTATGWAEVLYETLVRIPLGTVVLEEVAFRGALPALLTRWYRERPFRGDLAASALFGLWHVLPAWNVASANPVARDLLSGAAARPISVTGAVLGTTAVGLVLCWLRRRAGSLAAPIGAHVASNSIAYLLAYLVTR